MHTPSALLLLLLSLSLTHLSLRSAHALVYVDADTGADTPACGSSPAASLACRSLRAALNSTLCTQAAVCTLMLAPTTFTDTALVYDDRSGPPLVVHGFTSAAAYDNADGEFILRAKTDWAHRGDLVALSTVWDCAYAPQRALTLTNQSLALSNVRVRRCVSDAADGSAMAGAGGALLVRGARASLSLTNVSFEDNRASRAGGAVFVDGADALAVDACALLGNRVNDTVRVVYAAGAGVDVDIDGIGALADYGDAHVVAAAGGALCARNVLGGVALLNVSSAHNRVDARFALASAEPLLAGAPLPSAWRTPAALGGAVALLGCANVSLALLDALDDRASVANGSAFGGSVGVLALSRTQALEPAVLVAGASAAACAVDVAALAPADAPLVGLFRAAGGAWFVGAAVAARAAVTLDTLAAHDCAAQLSASGAAYAVGAAGGALAVDIASSGAGAGAREGRDTVAVRIVRAQLARNGARIVDSALVAVDVSAGGKAPSARAPLLLDAHGGGAAVDLCWCTARSSLACSNHQVAFEDALVADNVALADNNTLVARNATLVVALAAGGGVAVAFRTGHRPLAFEDLANGVLVDLGRVAALSNAAIASRNTLVASAPSTRDASVAVSRALGIAALGGGTAVLVQAATSASVSSAGVAGVATVARNLSLWDNCTALADGNSVAHALPAAEPSSSGVRVGAVVAQGGGVALHAYPLSAGVNGAWLYVGVSPGTGVSLDVGANATWSRCSAAARRNSVRLSAPGGSPHGQYAYVRAPMVAAVVAGGGGSATGALLLVTLSTAYAQVYGPLGAPSSWAFATTIGDGARWLDNAAECDSNVVDSSRALISGTALGGSVLALVDASGGGHLTSVATLASTAAALASIESSIALGSYDCTGALVLLGDDALWRANAARVLAADVRLGEFVSGFGAETSGVAHAGGGALAVALFTAAVGAVLDSSAAAMITAGAQVSALPVVLGARARFAANAAVVQACALGVESALDGIGSALGARVVALADGGAASLHVALLTAVVTVSDAGGSLDMLQLGSDGSAARLWLGDDAAFVNCSAAALANALDARVLALEGTTVGSGAALALASGGALAVHVATLGACTAVGLGASANVIVSSGWPVVASIGARASWTQCAAEALSNALNATSLSVAMAPALANTRGNLVAPVYAAALADGGALSAHLGTAFAAGATRQGAVDVLVGGRGPSLLVLLGAAAALEQCEARVVACNASALASTVFDGDAWRWRATDVVPVPVLTNGAYAVLSAMGGGAAAHVALLASAMLSANAEDLGGRAQVTLSVGADTATLGGALALAVAERSAWRANTARIERCAAAAAAPNPVPAVDVELAVGGAYGVVAAEGGALALTSGTLAQTLSADLESVTVALWGASVDVGNDSAWVANAARHTCSAAVNVTGAPRSAALASAVGGALSVSALALLSNRATQVVPAGMVTHVAAGGVFARNAVALSAWSARTLPLPANDTAPAAGPWSMLVAGGGALALQSALLAVGPVHMGVDTFALVGASLCENEVRVELSVRAAELLVGGGALFAGASVAASVNVSVDAVRTLSLVNASANAVLLAPSALVDFASGDDGDVAREAALTLCGGVACALVASASSEGRAALQLTLANGTLADNAVASWARAADDAASAAALRGAVRLVGGTLAVLVENALSAANASVSGAALLRNEVATHADLSTELVGGGALAMLSVVPASPATQSYVAVAACDALDNRVVCDARAPRSPTAAPATTTMAAGGAVFFSLASPVAQLWTKVSARARAQAQPADARGARPSTLVADTRLLGNSVAGDGGTNGSSAAPAALAALGGAVFADSDAASVLRCTLSGNTVGSATGRARGGALYSTSALVVADSELRSNVASSGFEARGGALALDLQPFREARVSACNFSANAASVGGSIALVGSLASRLDVSDSVVLDSSASAIGGGVFVSNAQLVMRGARSEVARNRASIDGGGVFVDLHDNATRLEHVAVHDNSALGGDGGGVYASAIASVALASCNVTDNVAEASGGGVALAGAGDVSACTFERNLAGKLGGALASTAAQLGVADCAFVGNTATLGGSALAIVGVSSATVSRTRLVDNGIAVCGPGGALHCADSAVVSLDAVEASGNRAASGGALHVANAAFVSVRNANLSYNTVFTGDGGGVLVEQQASLHADNMTVVGNVARGGRGGGLAYASVAPLLLADSLVAGNVAERGGGIAVLSEAWPVQSAQPPAVRASTSVVRDNVAALPTGPVLAARRAGAGADIALDNSWLGLGAGGGIYWDLTDLGSLESLEEALRSPLLPLVHGNVAVYGPENATSPAFVAAAGAAPVIGGTLALRVQPGVPAAAALRVLDGFAQVATTYGGEGSRVQCDSDDSAASVCANALPGVDRGTSNASVVLRGRPGVEARALLQLEVLVGVLGAQPLALDVVLDACALGSGLDASGACVACAPGTYTLNTSAPCGLCTRALADGDALPALECLGGAQIYVQSGAWALGPAQVAAGVGATLCGGGGGGGVLSPAVCAALDAGVVPTFACPYDYCTRNATRLCDGAPPGAASSLSPGSACVLSAGDGGSGGDDGGALCRDDLHRNASSVLCGACDAGYVSWNGRCVACDDDVVFRAAPLAALLAKMGAIALLNHVVAQRSADGASGFKQVVFVYQMSALAVYPSSVAGSVVSLAPFAQVYAALSQSLGALGAGAGGDAQCPFYVTPLADVWLQVAQPLAYFALLALMFALQRALVLALAALAARGRGRVTCAHRVLVFVQPSATLAAYVRTAIVFGITLFEGVAASVLAFTTCYAPLRVVYLYPAIECHTGTYAAHLAALLAVLGVVCAAPVVAAALLARRARRGTLGALVPWAGVYFGEYREHVVWWESVMLLRRAALLALFLPLVSSGGGVLGDGSGLGTVAVGKVVLAFAVALLIVLQVAVRPFRNALMNHLELGALTALLLVVAVNASGSTQDASRALAAIATVVILCAAAVALLAPLAVDLARALCRGLRVRVRSVRRARGSVVADGASATSEAGDSEAGGGGAGATEDDEVIVLVGDSGKEDAESADTERAAGDSESTRLL